MTLTKGEVRENHVVEFVEGQRIAWKPAEPGQAPVGHLWCWEVRPIDDVRSLVVHTYDSTEMTDPPRYPRARATTSELLELHLDRLASIVQPLPVVAYSQPSVSVHACICSISELRRVGN